MNYLIKNDTEVIGKASYFIKDNIIRLDQKINNNFQNIELKVDKNFYVINSSDSYSLNNQSVMTTSILKSKRRIIEVDVNNERKKVLLSNDRAYYSKIIPFLINKIDFSNTLTVFNNSFPNYFEAYIKKIGNETLYLCNKKIECKKYLYYYSISPNEKTILWINEELGLIKMTQNQLSFDLIDL